MDWFEVLKTGILGIIQGLTEFLPISSTGHLFLGRKLFGLESGGLFLDTMLHLGTLVAVITVYWREIVAILKHPFQRLTLLLLIGTIPALALGFIFQDFFDALETSGATIGWEFLITAALLWSAEMMKKGGDKKLEQITFLDALIIGIAQAFAIFPAISRSGSTIAGALFRRIEKETATYFSFLLSIPAIGAAVGWQLVKIVRGSAHEVVSPVALIVGIILSGIFGYLAVRWMIATLKKGSLKWFAIYVFILGIGIIIAQFTHVAGF